MRNHHLYNTLCNWFSSISGWGWDSSGPGLRWWILEHFCSPYTPPSLSWFFFINTFSHKTNNPQCIFYLTYMYVDNVLIYQQSTFQFYFNRPKQMNCNQLFPRSFPSEETEQTQKIKQQRWTWYQMHLFSRKRFSRNYTQNKSYKLKQSIKSIWNSLTI